MLLHVRQLNNQSHVSVSLASNSAGFLVSGFMKSQYLSLRIAISRSCNLSCDWVWNKLRLFISLRSVVFRKKLLGGEEPHLSVGSVGL